MSQKADREAHRAAFGANQWLVDELYEQYLTDRDSVDPAWWDFFADYRPRTEAAGPADGAPRRRSGADRDGQNGEPAAAAEPDAEPAPPHAPSTPSDRPAPDAQARRSPAQATPRTPREPDGVAPVATAQPSTAPYAEQPESRVHWPTAPEEPVVERLRGPAARVVTNMEASLAVPTATSVRAIPAKLMTDNRTVINNHLEIGRAHV